MAITIFLKEFDGSGFSFYWMSVKFELFVKENVKCLPFLSTPNALCFLFYMRRVQSAEKSWTCLKSPFSENGVRDLQAKGILFGNR